MKFQSGRTLIYFFSFIEQVLKPKGAYKGQKLIKLVITKTPARISKTVPRVPEIVPVYASTPITTAISILIILSADPIFFFI